MNEPTLTCERKPDVAEPWYRPLYARALGLRHLHLNNTLCFLYLEGAVVLGVLLALAELVSWWVVLALPVSIALMVKGNDLVAGMVARSAARTPEQERERVRREVVALMPAIDPVTVAPVTVGPDQSHAVAALTEATAQLPIAAKQLDGGPLPDQSGEGADEEAGDPLTEATAQYPVVPQPDQDIDPVAAGRRDTAGWYAAAGRYLDAAWRQHARAMGRAAEKSGHHE